MGRDAAAVAQRCEELVVEAVDVGSALTSAYTDRTGPNSWSAWSTRWLPKSRSTPPPVDEKPDSGGNFTILGG
jgi:hypothetical protein